MGLDPQERLAKSNKTGNMQDRIWRELVKLHAVNNEKPTEKFVGRKRETMQEEGEEHQPVAAQGLGDAFTAGEDDLLPSNKESFLLSLDQIGFFKFRRDPAGRRVSALLLCHWFLVHDSLHGRQEELRLGAAKKLRSARKNAAMAAAEEQGTGKQ
jgi:hypothetical protein